MRMVYICIIILILSCSVFASPVENQDLSFKININSIYFLNINNNAKKVSVLFPLINNAYSMKQTFYENRFSYFPLLIQNGTASDGPVILEPEDPVKTDETQKNGQNQDTPGSSQIGLTIAGVGLGLLAAGFASWAGINEDEDDSGYEEEDEQPISDEAFGIIIGISSLVMIVGLIIYAFEVSNNTDKKDKTAYFDQQMQKAFAVKTFYNSNSIALAAPDVKLNLMKVKF